MCQYCEQGKSLLIYHKSKGVLYNQLQINLRVDLSLLSGGHLNLYTSANISEANRDLIDPDEIVEEHKLIPIHYCPFCGRPLTKTK